MYDEWFDEFETPSVSKLKCDYCEHYDSKNKKRIGGKVCAECPDRPKAIKNCGYCAICKFISQAPPVAYGVMGISQAADIKEGAQDRICTKTGRNLTQEAMAHLEKLLQTGYYSLSKGGNLLRFNPRDQLYEKVYSVAEHIRNSLWEPNTCAYYRFDSNKGGLK